LPKTPPNAAPTTWPHTFEDFTVSSSILCPQTRRNIAFAFVIAGLQLLRSNVVLAADDEPVVTVKTAEAPAPAGYTVEIKPIVTFGALALGGVGLGLGGEKKLDDHLAVTATAQGLRYDLRDKTAQKLRDKKGDDYAFAEKGVGYGMSVGARYYGAPEGGSWYVGAGLGASREDGRWERGDQRADLAVTTYGVTGEGGYRWIADSGFMLRVGAGALIGARTRDIDDVADAGRSSTDFEKDLAKKYPTNRVAVQPVLDVGFGYTF
jgi:hypothetical protein